jgi:hypothetical protein
MFKIYHLLEKFLIYFNLKNKSLNLSHTKNNIASIDFLLNQEDIDINFCLPDIKNKSNEEMVIIAENYANFLLTITSGEMNEKICQLFNKQIKSDTDPNLILFIDNIISFWLILYKEKNKKRIKKYDQFQPLIRPIEVFK